MEIVGTVLERYGLAASLMVSQLIAFGYTIRHLYMKTTALETKLLQQATDHSSALLAVASTENERRADMRTAHDRETATLHQQILEEARSFSSRIDDVQERRSAEIREIVTASVAHMRDTKAAVEKVTDAVLTFRDLLIRE